MFVLGDSAPSVNECGPHVTIPYIWIEVLIYVRVGFILFGRPEGVSKVPYIFYKLEQIHGIERQKAGSGLPLLDSNVI